MYPIPTNPTTLTDLFDLMWPFILNTHCHSLTNILSLPQAIFKVGFLWGSSGFIYRPVNDWLIINITRRTTWTWTNRPETTHIERNNYYAMTESILRMCTHVTKLRACDCQIFIQEVTLNEWMWRLMQAVDRISSLFRIFIIACSGNYNEILLLWIIYYFA